jgi:hypothetical protein
MIASAQQGISRDRLSTTDPDLVAALADVLFECELLLNLPSDELYILTAEAELKSLYTGQWIGAFCGVGVVLYGSVVTCRAGLSSCHKRGDFIASEQEAGVEVLANSEVVLFWIAPEHIDRICRQNRSFRSCLYRASKSLPSAPRARGTIAPPPEFLGPQVS